MAILNLIRKPKDGAKGADEEAARSTRKRAVVICGAALPLLIAMYALLLWWSAPHTSGHQLRLDEYGSLIDRQAIKDATALVSDGRFVGSYDTGKGSARYWVSYGGSEALFSGMVTSLTNNSVPVKIKQQPFKTLVAPASVLLPALILVDGMFLLFLTMGRGGEGFMAYGKSGGRRVGANDAKITFSDVAGLDEAIEELGEVRDYLTNAQRFAALGASVPKGILLTGEPGCGKTLLARALAGETGVPFFSISGSEFVEVFVGVGASRIRDFFKIATANVPCIVFIDELDALGRSRTVTAMGGADEREATLNQLLVEMDGFDSGSGVVVVAATNRPDILDSALLRPGRFDRRLAIDRPDVKGREGILAVHFRGKPLAPGVDVSALARFTTGFTGADLANVVNEAALLAARRGHTAIEQHHLLEAVERVMAGPERRSRVLSDADRTRIAFHEAGHAVAAAATVGAHPVRKLSIVARNHATGFTWMAPEGDSPVVTRSQLIGRITAILGGRAAEVMVTGESSSGSTGDLEAAGALVRRMIMEYGMSEHMGPFSVKPYAVSAASDGVNAGYSEHVAAEIDAEVRKVLHHCDEQAMAVLGQHRGVLDAVAEALMASETLEGDDLDRLLRPIGRQVLAPVVG